MIKNWLILPFLLLMFLVTSCGSDDPEPGPYKRTVLVYIAGDNLLTFTGLDGIDPEAPASNNRGAYYGNMKKVTLGLKVTF